VYFTQSYATLYGSLEIQKFKETWQRATARHPILRTALLLRDEPLQVVHAKIEVSIHQEDWRTLPVSEHASRLEDCCKWIGIKEWTWRAHLCGESALICTQNDQHVFVLSMHHVLLDGWSMARLLGETLRDYFASTQNIAHIEIAQARP